jgi:ferredoxin
LFSLGELLWNGRNCACVRPGLSAGRKRWTIAPMDSDRFRLELADQGKTIWARADQTLLQSLLAAGLPWTSSCRNGSCRSCLGRIEAGAVRYLVPWPGLSAEEKAEGLVLPCVACPTSDLRLRFVGI